MSLTLLIGISTGVGFFLLFGIFVLVLHCERKRRIRRKLIEVTEVPQVDHDSNLNCQRDNKHPKEPAQITPDLVFSSNITAQPIIQTPIEVSDTNRMLRNNN